MWKRFGPWIAVACVGLFVASAASAGRDADAAAEMLGSSPAQQKKEASRFRLLFVDVEGSKDAADLAEGKLLARALRYQLAFDYTYRDEPWMSRVYPAADLDHALGKEVDTRALMERAGEIEIVTELLTGPKQFAELLAKYRPNVVHVLAHGAGKASFAEASWSDHGGTYWPMTQIQSAVAKAKLDLSSTLLVTPACDFGRAPVLEGLRSIGFGCVIAWPGSVCVSEAFEFHCDLYEALVSQYVLQRGDEPFWSFEGGCPPALRRAFDFATKCLEQRYRLLDEHFGELVGTRDVAGYYLHTKSWTGKPYEYAALPAMSCGVSAR